MGNPAQIRQIVMNLIINSSEAMGTKDGTIRVGTSAVKVSAEHGPGEPADLPAGNYLRLEIADTGCGMSEAVKARIFDPFFSTKFAGRGLGLAVVQGIVRAHAGAIHLTSAPGQGTTFQIFLPFATEAVAAIRDDRAQAPPDPAERTSGTVLLVEDEESLRWAVAKLLRDHGWSVIEAENGPSAIGEFRAHPDRIDVILLDMTIPGAPSSREIIEETIRVRPKIQLILMSAYPREMAASALHAPQIRAFLRKPFSLRELIQGLQAALRAKAAGA
jgi:CheY-like chemotaxis protein